MIFWGMSFVWTKIVFTAYGPVTTITLRLIIATAILSLFIVATGKREKIQRSDLKYFILLSFLEPFCYFIGESFGLKVVSATLASVIIATIPVVTPVFAWFVLKERLSIINVLGLFLSFFGVVVIVVAPKFQLIASPAELLLLGFAVLSAVGYGLLVRKIANRYSSMTIVNLQNFIGILFFLPVFFLTEFHDFISARPGVDVIQALLALAILCSAVAFVLMTIAIREIGISRFNVFTNIIPVCTALFAWMLLGEPLHARKMIGITIVIAGLFLSQLAGRKRPRKAVHFIEG
ncbi:MAG: EamA/RhaT family transporter [Acidobacteria bacterium]|nr:MAG: EamA/RhaT family transporter [Acidobacteriota bacterium]